MLLNYLEIVKKISDPEVYALGQKLYLKGHIVSKKDLVLDYWRMYEIVDNQRIYTVKIPILHLALSPEKYDQAEEALLQSVWCDYEMVEENLVSQYVVAVCLDLQNEFVPKTKKVDVQKNVNSILDSVLEVENNKKQREFLSNLEYFLNGDNPENSKFIYKIGDFLKDNSSEDLNKNSNKNLELKNKIEEIIEKVLGDYTAEKRFVSLMTDSYIFNSSGKNWWIFWSKYFSKMDDQNKINLWTKLWRFYLLDFTEGFENEFLNIIQKEDDCIKQKIFENLKDFFKENREVPIIFIFQSKYLTWIEKNLDSLDSKYLLKSVLLLPEKSEEIEIKILNQMKVRSDFLIAGDYEDILEDFKNWKKNLGRTVFLEEAVKYFRQNHPKKRSLLNKLEDL